MGLHRLEGLGGDVSSCVWSFSLKVDATDLLLLWSGRAGLTNSSRDLRSGSVSLVMVALLWLDVGLEAGLDDGSIELSLLSVGGRSLRERLP